MTLSGYRIDELLQKRKRLRRELLEREGLQSLRIAVLGGVTTNELVDLLELHLLDAGFAPVFYQSEYGRYYEEAVLDSNALLQFSPDLVYIHTTSLNAQALPDIGSTRHDLADAVASELARFTRIWQALEQKLPAQILQNNFELPAHAVLGNLDAVQPGGASRFFLELNAAFAEAAAHNPRLLLVDMLRLSATVGLEQWYDCNRYFSYKLLHTPRAHVAIARSLTSMVCALYGRSKKVLVLDLDNTLWGGVIGDDGIDKIQIGRETPVAEAFAAFQEYCLSLQRRGVLLAVCSKNNEETARSGFEHPDSVLKLEHFSAFKANWEPKHENILAIARELNLGVDSFVFVDDNPAERLIVSSQIPSIAVPDVGDDVSRYADHLEQGRYFEAISMSQEDLGRAALYRENAERTTLEGQFSSYGEYLESLDMVAEIDRFKPVYIERIAQLTNKTNQFNLTTRRYTLAEIEAVLDDPHAIGIYGRLMDRFGDNGLISIVLGYRQDDLLRLDLWLMSCRVLKREMELAMLDVLIRYAQAIGATALLGEYIPTRKNGMVAKHYEDLGFTCVHSDETTGASSWQLEIAGYTPRTTHIRIKEAPLG